MENNLFDNEIKKLLEDIEVPFEGGHWDELAQRLKETTVPNDPDVISTFDQALSEKATSFDVPFNEHNWLALRQRLIANAYLHKWILHTKVLESISMALLAFLFISTVDLSEKTPKVRYNGPIASTIAPAKSSNQADKFEPAQENEVLAIRKAIPSVADLSFVPLQSKPSLLRDYSGGFSQVSQSNPEPLAIGDAATNDRDIFLLFPIELLDMELLNHDDLDLPRIAFAKKGRSNLGIAVYGVIHADYIQTGRDEKYNINLPDIWSPGYGAGVALSKQVGRKIYNIGIEYQSTKYHPKPIVVISEGDASEGYAGTGTSTVEVSMVKLPVTVGYALFENKRHQVSLNLGVTAGLATELYKQSTFVLASHNDQDQKKLEAKMLSANQSSIYSQSIARSGEITDLQETKAKLFAFANANFGYEYRLPTGHSLFAKASYQHQISAKGIGLPNDKLHSVGFQFGLRAYL